PDVEDHQCRPALAHGVSGFGAVVGAAGGGGLILQGGRGQGGGGAVLVDDENIVAHDSIKLSAILRADHCAAVACERTDAISFASRRNTRLMRAPPPSRSSSARYPPCSSMIFLTIASPRP